LAKDFFNLGWLKLKEVFKGRRFNWEEPKERAYYFTYGSKLGSKKFFF